MKQEDGKGIGNPVHKYYFFPSEACDFSRGYFTRMKITTIVMSVKVMAMIIRKMKMVI